MGKPSIGTLSEDQQLVDRLDSWKEIAAYLKRDVTTVQRWEKREGMPVHRHLHDSMGSVYASRKGLDAWARSRNSGALQEVSAEATADASEPADPPLSVAPPPTYYVRPRGRLILLAAAIAVVLALVAIFWLEHVEYFWRNPIAGAHFEAITDFDGLEQAATLSRDGQFVAFLSDRTGQMDVWVTQVGSGEFHNLTHGKIPGLINPLIRTPEFSPDGSLVTFWVRRPDSSNGGNIDIWAVPTLGGEPRPYLDGVAEFDWSHNGSRLAYHTSGPGDPLFVTDGIVRPASRPIFTAPAGLHSHFPLWAPDETYLYVVQGLLPDKLDLWRIRPEGGAPERITTHNSHVSHPVFLNQRTLMYLASDADGSGPWLYSIDPAHRIPHRLNPGFDRYTSLAASADGHRLVATLATPKRTLWRLQLDGSATSDSVVVPIPLSTTSGFSPRLGPDYLLYVSATGTGESILKLRNGATTELWRGEGARIFGGPAISSDGRHIAFSARQRGQTLLYIMDADGANARIVVDSLDLQGAPAWAPDGRSITMAVSDHGISHLFRIPTDAHSPTSFVAEYSVDPTWSSDGRIAFYSGPDIGTTFSVKAITANGTPYPAPPLTLTRGGRHLVFLANGRKLVILQGDIQHKDLWLKDLDTGIERQMTKLPPEFDVSDFDVSADGRQIVLERVQDRSSVVLLDLPAP
ncbi:TolB-like translocation protein [Granulicella arctica]|uniref:hypothetical protein n=1 Tax=Granulicella arctica TaxID=940613 RepID=UPI0021DF77CA|nr:hypothetical protein [Granulicella arctica]